MQILDAVLGWGTVALIIALPVLLGAVGLIVHFSSKPVEEKYATGGGGLAGGFAGGLEEVFSPTAHDSRAELDRMTKRTAPSPAPSDPPWTITGDRIRIDV